MKIEEMFAFLVEGYGYNYKYQLFTNCYGSNWQIEAHSFYNNCGCFTIYIEIQRSLGFWFASKFSTNYEDLCEREIDISLIEPEIWDKHEKLWIFKNPFFWWDNNKVLNTLAEVLRVHLSKGNSLF